MSSAYLPSTRGAAAWEVSSAGIDDFMNWLLYGEETWLVAVLKGVPLFFFMYFLLFYIPNYVYYAITLYIPFLQFSKDVGFLVANLVGGGNFTRHHRHGHLGAGCPRPARLRLVADPRTSVFLQYAGHAAAAASRSWSSTWAAARLIPPRLPAAGDRRWASIAAGLGAATLVYLWLEYLRVNRAPGGGGRAASAALQARG